MNIEYIKISELNNYIKNLLDNNSFLNKVYLKGEISNFKAHTRGHFYFTIKDENTRINAVMFSTYAKDVKFDEWQTQLSDIEAELNNYTDKFKGKVVFCN